MARKGIGGYGNASDYTTAYNALDKRRSQFGESNTPSKAHTATAGGKAVRAFGGGPLSVISTAATVAGQRAGQSQTIVGTQRRPGSDDVIAKTLENGLKAYFENDLDIEQKLIEYSNSQDGLEAEDKYDGDFLEWFYGDSEGAQFIRAMTYDNIVNKLEPDAMFNGCSTDVLFATQGTTRDQALIDIYGAVTFNGFSEAKKQREADTLLAGAPYNFSPPTIAAGKTANGDGTSTLIQENPALVGCNFNPCSTSNFTTDGMECVIQKLGSLEARNAFLALLVAQKAGKDIRSAANILVDIKAGKVPTGVDVNFLRKTLDDLNKANPYISAQTVSFKEQCFLLTHIQTFVALKNLIEEQAANNNTAPFEKYLASLVRKDLPEINSRGARGNRSLLVHGDPFGFINKLTQAPTKEYFFRINEHELSTFQPMINLYKVQTTEEGEEYQVLMSFNSYYGKSDRLGINHLSTRGHGVGIESFSFKYEATNFYSLKKAISAKLVIFANSFSELLEERDGYIVETGETKPAAYKYADLALKTGNEKAFRKLKINPKQRDVVLQNLEKLDFRLKVVVGYANPARSGLVEHISTNAQNAVYNSFITLNLTPTIHDFDVDDLGRVKFTINYLAYVDEHFDQPHYNIFTDIDATKSQIVRTSTLAALNEKCSSGISEILNTNEAKAKIEEEKALNLQSIIKSLLNKDRIRYLGIPINELNRYRSGGPLEKIDNSLLQQFYTTLQAQAARGLTNAGKVNSGLNDDTKVFVNDRGEINSAASTVSDADLQQYMSARPLNPIENITFFWVSDLVDSILADMGNLMETMPGELAAEIAALAAKTSGLSSGDLALTQVITSKIREYNILRDNFKRLRVVLGPVELVNTNEEGKIIRSFFTSFGDIPISVKYFMEWMTNKVLKTQRQTYSLSAFLSDFFNSFVKDFLNRDTCYGNAVQQKTFVGNAVISAYNKSNTPFLDDIQANLNPYRRLDITYAQAPVLSVMGNRDDPRSVASLDSETNYLVFYAGRVMPAEKKGGILSQDVQNGIFHYGLGEKKGFVKKISLEKTTTPYLAELRYTQEGFDGLQQLLVLYDANIETFFDPTAFPGTYIFVEPRSFDPGLTYDITKLGIGGYFMITEAEHMLKAGKAHTKFSAKWTDQVSKEAGEAAGLQGSEDSQCPAVQNERVEGLDYQQMLNKAKSTPGVGNLVTLLGTNTTATTPYGKKIYGGLEKGGLDNEVPDFNFDTIRKFLP